MLMIDDLFDYALLHIFTPSDVVFVSIFSIDFKASAQQAGFFHFAKPATIFLNIAAGLTI